MTDARFVLFDYNEHLESGDVIVPSLYDQAKILEIAIDRTDSDNITIVAHSQGCIVAALADLDEKVKRVILLAPPTKVSSDDLEAKLKELIGPQTSLKSGIALPYSHGKTMYFTKGYVESINEVQPRALYENLASRTPTVIVRPTQDELLDPTEPLTIPGAELLDIQTNHNFTTHDARKQLTEIIKSRVS